MEDYEILDLQKHCVRLATNALKLADSADAIRYDESWDKEVITSIIWETQQVQATTTRMFLDDEKAHLEVVKNLQKDVDRYQTELANLRDQIYTFEMKARMWDDLQAVKGNEAQARADSIIPFGGDNKIEIIRQVREKAECGLRIAKETVDRWIDSKALVWDNVYNLYVPQTPPVVMEEVELTSVDQNPFIVDPPLGSGIEGHYFNPES